MLIISLWIYCRTIDPSHRYKLLKITKSKYSSFCIIQLCVVKYDARMTHHSWFNVLFEWWYYLNHVFRCSRAQVCIKFLRCFDNKFLRRLYDIMCYTYWYEWKLVIVLCLRFGLILFIHKGKTIIKFGIWISHSLCL